jgi:flagellar basal-body rod protein FlgB
LLGRIFNRQVLTEKAINASVLKNETISQNIANVDTPGYKRKDVRFEEMLSSAAEKRVKGFRSDPRHIPIGEARYTDAQAKIYTDHSNSQMRLDGNNVDIDSEMASMAKNTIKYNVLVQNLNNAFRRIKSAINEGRR